jgi:hypothetical protein
MLDAFARFSVLVRPALALVGQHRYVQVVVLALIARPPAGSAQKAL